MNTEQAIAESPHVESHEVATQAAPLPAATPMEMLDRALQSNADLEVIDKLMTLQERWEANQGRKEFDAAVAAAKAETPVVQANRTGHNNKRYADFAAFARVVDPILGKHGLGYRFRTTQDDRISVTCILFHRAGHYEETTLSGPADVSGNKNAIQAIGSTLTYLQRYSLKQALGLAAAEDDDGAGAPITEEQFTALRAALDEVEADIPLFCEYLGVGSLPEIPANKLDKAWKAIELKRRKAAKP